MHHTSTNKKKLAYTFQDFRGSLLAAYGEVKNLLQDSEAAGAACI